MSEYPTTSSASHPSQPDMGNKLVESSTADILILKGSAGTGKTTLVGNWVKQLTESKKRFALLATTGRAAKILSEKTKNPAQTVHSTIYSFSDLAGQPEDTEVEISMDQAGQLYFRFLLRESQDQSIKPEFYIVDEASMISHEVSKNMHTAQFGTGSLLDDFIHFAGEEKIVFVGDHCQLPPVSQSPFSSALSAAFLQERYQKRVEEIELTVNWRHGDVNEILDIANHFRDHILQKTFHRNLRISRPQGTNAFLHPSLETLVNQYAATLKPNRDFASATMVAATNKLVNSLNWKIRDHLAFRGMPQVGELLSVIQNSNVTPLVNGDLVILEEIKPDVTISGISFSKVVVRPLQQKEKYECLMITNLLFNVEPSLNVNDAGKLIIDYDRRARSRGMKRKSKSYIDGLRSDPYLNALRVKFGYVLTCHKSQGGEWDTVYLALNGAQYYFPPETTARWYYTAITRARKQLHINDGAWISKSP